MSLADRGAHNLPAWNERCHYGMASEERGGKRRCRKMSMAGACFCPTHGGQRRPELARLRHLVFALTGDKDMALRMKTPELGAYLGVMCQKFMLDNPHHLSVEQLLRISGELISHGLG